MMGSIFFSVFFFLFKFDSRICYEKKFFVEGYLPFEATFQSVQERKWLKCVSNRILSSKMLSAQLLKSS